MRMNKKLYYTYDEVIHLFQTEFSELVKMARGCDHFSMFARQWSLQLQLFTHEVQGNRKQKQRETPKSLAEQARERLYHLFVMENGVEVDEASGEKIAFETLSLFWNALCGDTSVTPDFMLDMYYLLKQTRLQSLSRHPRECLHEWSNRWVSGLDGEVIAEQQENRQRIQQLLVKKIERKNNKKSNYLFEPEWEVEKKREKVQEWWYDYAFQLAMAIRDPDELNHFLSDSLSRETMQLLHQAKHKKIPFFVTPYYLSLLSIRPDGYNDEAIRSYVIYSPELVESFGDIKAWEKEDEVVPGEPNAAGWLLPNEYNIHRRYPEVAIFIPDSRGRACGGLCAPCQRMYDFQKGRLNFDLEALKPTKDWTRKLEWLIKYYENDPRLCDILITGGDSLMSQDNTLREILDAVYQMAERKKMANYKRQSRKKYAEIQRVRLGSRLPAYLPYRITDSLVGILKDFRERAMKIGIRQFFVQTHFESPLEVTQEVIHAIRRLQEAGWIVTNQLVFTVAASRRGHTAQLRKVLNQAGVISYYTFSVKGFNENYALFAPNSRSLQEKEEEKKEGEISPLLNKELLSILEKPEQLQPQLTRLLSNWGHPFVATDRNVMNLPGIGKSMTFTTIGITREGKRVLCFKLDAQREHSPSINKKKKVYIVENKSIAAYLRQLEEIGEHPEAYESIWYYNEGITEPRFTLFEYPE